MIWRALQFDFPTAAWLLPLVMLLLGILIFLYSYRQRKLQEFASQAVLNEVVVKREPIIYWIKVLLFCLAWICGVFTLMQPKGNERYISTSQNGQVVASKRSSEKTVLRKKAHEVIFLIDASASMKIDDVSGKTRLEAAKEIVDDVIRNLKGENVSLFAFTSVTIQIVPSTLDYLFTRLMLQQIAINEGETEGTNFEQALEYLRKRYFEQAAAKTKTLIVLSDGGDTTLYGISSENQSKSINEIVALVADAREKNLRVLTVGLGSSQEGNVPNVTYKGQPVLSTSETPLLRKLAANGNGEFFVSKELTPFQISQKLNQSIAKDETFIDASIDNPPPDYGERTRTYDYYFQYPLAIAILALLGCFLIPDTHRKINGGHR